MLKTTNPQIEALEKKLQRLNARLKKLNEEQLSLFRQIRKARDKAILDDLKESIGDRVHVPDRFSVRQDLKGLVGVMVAVGRTRITIDYGEPYGRWTMPWECVAPEGSSETYSGTYLVI